MKSTLLLLLIFVFANCRRGEGETNFTPSPPGTAKNITVDSCKKCIVLAEQSQNRIAIADVTSQKIIWEWKPELSNVGQADVKWFSNPSDAKPVYDAKYLLITASGGGVALVRIADKKALFYAYAGGNVHSASMLPDGNIVSASSTGNYLTIFSVDTLHFPEKVYSKKIDIPFGHNVVWDEEHKILLSAAMDELYYFSYNFNCTHPDLTLIDSMPLPGTEAHDLFPKYGKKILWLTNTDHVYLLDANNKKVTQANTSYQKNIKSVSSGPDGYPTIMILPKTSWWTDEVIDSNGNIIFSQQGLKIYKARWLLTDDFSGNEKKFAPCNN